MLLHWHFDPVLLSLGPMALRWYGLLFVGAFFMGQAVLERIFKREGVPGDKVQRLLLWALLGTIAGARLVHCLVYEPARYWADPLAMLRTWDGGLASHGGALGLLLALWLANRRIPPATPFLWLVDRALHRAGPGARAARSKMGASGLPHSPVSIKMNCSDTARGRRESGATMREIPGFMPLRIDVRSGRGEIWSMG